MFLWRTGGLRWGWHRGRGFVRPACTVVACSYSIACGKITFILDPCLFFFFFFSLLCGAVCGIMVIRVWVGVGRHGGCMP